MRRDIEARYALELERESDKKRRRIDQSERQQLGRLSLDRQRLAENGGDAANNQRLLREHDDNVGKLKAEWAESKQNADDKLKKRLSARKLQFV